MNFKSLMLLLLGAFVILPSCTNLSPTEVIARVDQIGDDAGTVTILNVPGRYRLPLIQFDDFRYKTNEQNYRWTEGEDSEYGSYEDEQIVLQIEGNNCFLETGIRFYIDKIDTTGLNLLVNSYPTNLDGIVDILLYERVRTNVQAALENKTLDYCMDNIASIFKDVVTPAVAKSVSKYGIIVVEVYTIKGLGVPQSVRERKELTQAMQQKTNEAEKRREEQAINNATGLDKARADSLMIMIRANAEYNAIKLMNKANPNKSILQLEYIKKWNGVEAAGSTDGSGVLIDIK